MCSLKFGSTEKKTNELLYSTLLYSRKNTFESTLTWKALSVKLLWKLMNLPYQILELELESLSIFYKRWIRKIRIRKTITDDHLRDTIRIATTKVIPNLQSIIQRKQLHPYILPLYIRRTFRGPQKRAHGPLPARGAILWPPLAKGNVILNK